MLDLETVERAVNEYARNTAFSGVPVVLTNINDNSESAGSVPWIKVKVLPQRADQIVLGNSDLNRQYGVLVIIIYVRKGNGTLDRDRLYKRMVDSFRGKLIGGATFQNVQPLIQGNNENWYLSGYQIPFYFNSI